MNYTLTHAKLSGEIPAPPSKSYAHRLIICAGLARENSLIKNIAYSEDILATIGAIKALGADVIMHKDSVEVMPNTPPKTAHIDCKESGSTMRFLMPIATALGVEATFVGEGKLPTRTFSELAELLIKNGAKFSSIDTLPATIKGSISGGIYDISGNISSQFVSGLLFALPLLKEDSKIKLTTPLQSKDYVEMTRATLQEYNVATTTASDGFLIKGGQSYLGGEKTCEGDFSSATFWLCAGAISGAITVTSLNKNSLQGDKKILEILNKIGAKITYSGDKITVEKNTLNPIEIDGADIPDMLPALAVVLTQCNGKSVIKNAQRLALKESNRLQAIYENLKALGADISITDSEITIVGRGPLSGGFVKGFNDHRIVMSMAIAQTVSYEKITISDIEAVKKSYPNFWENYKMLGGIYE